MTRSLTSISIPSAINGSDELGRHSSPDFQVREDLQQFKAQLHRRLVMGMDLAALATLNKDELQREVRRVADELCQQSSNLLNRQELRPSGQRRSR